MGTSDSADFETAYVEGIRKQHKISRAGGRFSGTCSCGRWTGYVGRYGPTSYAVHLAEEVAKTMVSKGHVAFYEGKYQGTIHGRGFNRQSLVADMRRLRGVPADGC